MAIPSEVRLTKTLVDAAVAGPKRQILWDSETKGFGFRLVPRVRKRRDRFLSDERVRLRHLASNSSRGRFASLCGPNPGAFSLAHNLGSQVEVDEALERLANFGGRILRPGDTPPHGGYRGYVADPDGHAWEIAWNPAWTFDELGRVTFVP